MNSKKIFIIYYILFVFSSISIVSSTNAAPSIISISGSLVDGAQVTITGDPVNDFGATGPTIHKWDNFEGATHSLGEAIGVGNGAIPWTYHEGNATCSEPKLSNNGSRTIGGQFVRCTWDYTDGRYLCVFHYQHGATLSPAYISFYMRWDYWGTYVSNNEKFWRLCNIDGSPYFRMVANPQHPDAASNIEWDMQGGDTLPGEYKTRCSEEQWVRVDLYGVENDQDVANGTIILDRQASENSSFENLFNVTNHKTRTVSTHWNMVQFGSYINLVEGVQYYHDFDDIYIASSRARVEIGDNATWDSCTHREIQIPTIWSDTSITITVNQGSFTDGENVYLFVVDADGIPSAGYGPITIGSGEKGDDTTPPGDVTDLTIQAGDGQIAFSWTNPMDSDFAGTMIRYRIDGIYPVDHDDGVEVCNKTASPGYSDTYTLTGLVNDTIYYFSVFTYDETGNYSEPTHISAVPSADIYTTPPGDVTDLTIQAGDGQIAFGWINPMDSDFAGTMIRYRIDGIYPVDHDDGVEVCNKTASPGYSDTYTLTGLVNDIIYYFSVFTYDETGNYSEAMHISAVPSADIYTKVFGDISGADFPQTCKDTYLNAGEAGVNYSNNSESLNTYTWPINTVANRIVMKWDLSALPQDVIIQEATLSLYMFDFEGTGGDDNYEIAAHKIINHNPDISSCTWNTYDATNSWTGGANGGEQDIAPAESSTIVDKTSGYKNWDITQMVQEWVDNSSTNLGLMLNSDTTAASDSNRYFRPTEYSNQDQRPILTIKYGSSDIPKVPSAPSGLGVSVNNE